MLRSDKTNEAAPKVNFHGARRVRVFVLNSYSDHAHKKGGMAAHGPSVLGLDRDSKCTKKMCALTYTLGTVCLAS